MLERVISTQLEPNRVEALAAYRGWVNFDDEVGRHIRLAVLESGQNAF